MPVTARVLENVPVVNAPVDGVVAPTVPLKAPPVIVSPATEVVVLPRYRAVLPSVIAVAKLVSSCDKGIELVAVAKMFGTAILKPHS
jgi:hypothetical protein